MKRKKFLPPFELEIERLGSGGVGVGIAPDGAVAQVRPAPPGCRVQVMPQGRSKGVWQARRLAMVRPALEWESPPCAVFGLCGGCTLQELGLEAQRRAKYEFAVRAVGAVDGVRIHEVRGTAQAYGYRNRVELSFGTRRYVSESEHAAGAAIDGRWLGFHAPGRFDRVVDTDRCWLVSDGLNEAIRVVRDVALDPAAPVPWDPHEHSGFWRHLLLRETLAGDRLVTIYTAPGDGSWVECVAERLMALDRPGSRFVGVVWAENAGVADVARGTVRRIWGEDRLFERLGPLVYRLSPTSFFQTSTRGAEVLYETVREALAGNGGTLLDLYCGIGSIGLFLADRFERVVGIEEHAESVEDARRNAAQNGIHCASFVHARVEDVLAELKGDDTGRSFVVDPPRAGLHPKVATALAAAKADTLVYVACNPASLGRDAEVLRRGGWRMTDLWIVDLFPQTGHVEAVARFVR